MIVFAALVPHSPLLLPSINKERLQEVKSTRSAMETIRESFTQARPDTVVVFSSHAKGFPRAFSLNLHPHYRVDLSEFGDFGHEDVLVPDLALSDRLQRRARRAGFSLALTSDPQLDYRVGVPLSLLTSEGVRPHVIPIGQSERSPKEHFRFGQLLKDIFLDTNARLAILGSGDHSHALSADSPAGFHRDGPRYDAKIQ
jgi:aromatic ring-opening dioxygenase LigB subunit